MRIVAVSEVTRYLKDLLEEDYYLQDVWVRGEVTNYTQAPSGHRYFSLKDERATLGCVLFRGSGGHVAPLRNGMAIVAHGPLSGFPERGAYSVYVECGEGAGRRAAQFGFGGLVVRLCSAGQVAGQQQA